MKAFISIIVLLTLGIIAVSSTKEVEDIAADCMAKFNVTQKQMEDAKMGAYKPEDVPVKLKCSVKCLLLKVQLLDPDTIEVIRENVKEKYPSITDDVIEKCKDMKGFDSCDNAYQFISCLWKQDAEIE